MLLTWRVVYTSLVSFEVLLLSNANWIVSSDYRSINMSVASLLRKIISRRHVFLPVKSTRFWRPESLFSSPEPSPSWSVMKAKTLGTKIPPVTARGPLFRRPETTSWGGLGRAEKFFLHGKNQAGRAPFYWPASQQWMSCKCALSIRISCQKCLWS